ncbi:MAG: hypothetical protein J7K59_01975 [Candidatus Korarchaeota archaeon]|nr:hypothetical protein [Candidatus Korarchaeota archaeon]
MKEIMYLRWAFIAFWAGDFEKAYNYYIKSAVYTLRERKFTAFRVLLRYAVISGFLCKLTKWKFRRLAKLDEYIKVIENEIEKEIKHFLVREGKPPEKAERLLNQIINEVKDTEIRKFRGRLKIELAEKEIPIETQKYEIIGNRFYGYLRAGNIYIARSYIRVPAKVNLSEVMKTFQNLYPNGYLRKVSEKILEAKIGEITFIIRDDTVIEAEGPIWGEKFREKLKTLANKIIDVNIE